MDETFTQTATIEIVKILKPLRRLNSAQRITAFVNELGWHFPGGEQLQTKLSSLVKLIEDIVSNVSDIIDAQSDDELLEAIAEIAEKTPVIIETINVVIPKIIDEINTIGVQNYIGDSLDKLPRRFFDYLLYTYLQTNYQKIFAVLHVIGIIETVNDDQDIPIKTVQWGRLPQLFSAPADITKEVYNWNHESDDFNGNEFLKRFEILLRAFLIPGGIYKQAENIRILFNRTDPDDDKEIRIPLYQSGVWDQSWTEFDLNLSPVPEDPNDNNKKPGLAIYPYMTSGLKIEEEVKDSWIISFKGTAELAAGLALFLRPPHNVEVQTEIFDTQASQINSQIEFSLRKTTKGDQLNYIFGSEDGSSLGFRDIEFKTNAEITSVASPANLLAEFNITELTLVIKSNDADSFINKLLGDTGIEANSDIGIGWSSLDGVYFKGSAGLEVTIPINKSLGPITVDNVSIAIKIDGRKIPVSLGSSFSAKLGPVIASVKRMGITFPISIPEDNSGNLGPLNIETPKFLPPKGAGLAIKAATVKGGGFLEYDDDNKRYAGILELGFGEIGLTAIGLITTQMPDGSKGFSMLAVIGVEFDPPISLPYNFNLSGVGGILGVQRTMNIEYLKDGLKQGTLDSVLFPQNPITNASRIISDLRAGFPPDKGRYLFGPMAIIGWSNPKIITAEVGIFIELPTPVRIAILGQLSAKLPNAEGSEETIVDIKLDVLGVLDFSKKSFSLDAVIYDSKILEYPLSGEMAMRLRWSDPPFFLVSFGGYNPRFKVDPGIPALRRMLYSIRSSKNLSITMESYLALSSNSAQVGSKLELKAKKSKFKAHGYLYYDSLFIFSPFSFVADMGAGVEIYAGKTCLLTTTLDLTLSGPTPWRAKGVAKFKVACFSKKIKFDKTWGRRISDTLPATDPWNQLYEALTNPGNWKEILPEKGKLLIRIKEINEPEPIILVHPRGQIEITQKVIPFKLKLEKFGNSPIAGDDEYSVTKINDINVTEPEAIPVTYNKDYYAIGQAVNLSNSEKLSRPSFEEVDMNIAIGTDTITTGDSLGYNLEYETEVIDEEKVTHQHEIPLTRLSAENGMRLIKGRAKPDTAFNRYMNTGKIPLVSAVAESYAVINKSTMQNLTEESLSYAQAQSIMSSYLHENPENKGNVQIVCEHERVS